MGKPERTFKAGAVRASIFRNQIERNGAAVMIPKVVLEVRYRDKDGNWKGTNSLSLNEVPKAITALQQAFEYLLSEDAKQRAMESGSGQGPPDAPKQFGPIKTMQV